MIYPVAPETLIHVSLTPDFRLTAVSFFVAPGTTLIVIYRDPAL